MSDSRRASEKEMAAWSAHERSQLKYFNGLTLRQKMEAVEGMADVVRRLREMRAQGRLHRSV